MTTTVQALDCGNGCQLERVKFLFEQYALTQDAMMNTLQDEYLQLCNFLEEVVIPLLEYHSTRGDLDANDALIDLVQLI